MVLDYNALASGHCLLGCKARSCKRKQKMRSRIFVIKCPNCGKIQPWAPRMNYVAGLTKQCTNCEKTFVPHKNINESQIVKEFKNIKEYEKHGKIRSNHNIVDT